MSEQKYFGEHGDLIDADKFGAILAELCKTHPTVKVIKRVREEPFRKTLLAAMFGTQGYPHGAMVMHADYVAVPASELFSILQELGDATRTGK